MDSKGEQGVAIKYCSKTGLPAAQLLEITQKAEMTKRH